MCLDGPLSRLDDPRMRADRVSHRCRRPAHVLCRPAHATCDPCSLRGSLLIRIVLKLAHPQPDENQEAERAVREATGTDPVNGEELLASEELRRQHRELKEQLAKEKRKEK